MRDIPIYFATWAAAAWLCLSLLPAAVGFAAAPGSPAAPTSNQAPISAPAQAQAQAATAAPAAAPSGEAAAKHAKRTACLKEAKAKKLVGADKTSFLKNCIAAP
jgi:hypothetical protein